MKRRDFLALAAGAAAFPLSARADSSVPKVGYLGLAPPDAEKPMFEAFLTGLRDVGYVPGQTIEVVFRTSGGGEDALGPLAKELVDQKVAVIVTGGPGVFVAHGVSPTTPVVASAFGAVDQLIALGFVKSLAEPSGSITGQTFRFDDLFVKRLELLKEVKPATRRVGVLSLQGSPFNQFFPQLAAAAKPMGLDLTSVEVAGPGDCERAFGAAPLDAVMVTDLPAFLVGQGPAQVAAAALARGMTSAGPVPFAPAGGLIGYGVDFPPMVRRSAVFVDKILKGAKPGDIPIEQAAKFPFLLNLKTAKALGLELPSTVLASADEVIE